MATTVQPAISPTSLKGSTVCESVRTNSYGEGSLGGEGASHGSGSTRRVYLRRPSPINSFANEPGLMRTMDVHSPGSTASGTSVQQFNRRSGTVKEFVSTHSAPASGAPLVVASRSQSVFSRISSTLVKFAPRKPKAKVCLGVVGLTEEQLPSFSPEILNICSDLTFSAATIGASPVKYACNTGTFDVPSIQRKAQLHVGEPLIERSIEEYDNDCELVEDFLAFVPNTTAVMKKKDKAAAHLLANLMLPHDVYPREVRKVAATFWLWLCIVDDQFESVRESKFDLFVTVVSCMMDLQHTIKVEESSPTCMKATAGLLHVLRNTDLDIPTNEGSDEQVSWKEDFLAEISAILLAFKGERPLLKARKKSTTKTLKDWMKVRMVTISVRPFMILAKASLGLSTEIDPLSKIPFSSGRVSPTFHSDNLPLLKIELLVQAVCGLQNDIVGWEKDHAERNPLNAIEILLFRQNPKREAFSSAVRSHNLLMQELLKQKEQYSANLTLELNNKEAGGELAFLGGDFLYLETLVNFTYGMAVWHTRSRRYAVN